jgi:hypothetical protein
LREAEDEGGVRAGGGPEEERVGEGQEDGVGGGAEPGERDAAGERGVGAALGATAGVGGHPEAGGEIEADQERDGDEREDGDEKETRGLEGGEAEGAGDSAGRGGVGEQRLALGFRFGVGGDGEDVAGPLFFEFFAGEAGEAVERDAIGVEGFEDAVLIAVEDDDGGEGEFGEIVETARERDGFEAALARGV